MSTFAILGKYIAYHVLRIRDEYREREGRTRAVWRSPFRADHLSWEYRVGSRGAQDLIPRVAPRRVKFEHWRQYEFGPLQFRSPDTSLVTTWGVCESARASIRADCA